MEYKKIQPFLDLNSLRNALAELPPADQPKKRNTTARKLVKNEILDKVLIDVESQ